MATQIYDNASKQGKVGDEVSYYNFTYEKHRIGKITAIDVVVEWMPNKPLGVQIDGSITRPYNDRYNGFEVLPALTAIENGDAEDDGQPLCRHGAQFCDACATEKRRQRQQVYEDAMNH